MSQSTTPIEEIEPTGPILQNGPPVPPTPPVESEQKRGFALPSAYTILFILILLTAAATHIVPAGTYEYNADGEPVPGTYQQIEHDPQKILLDSIKAPDQRVVRDRRRDGEHQLLELRGASSAPSTSRCSSSSSAASSA